MQFEVLTSKLLFPLLLILFLNCFGKAQTLNPDSLFNKVEEFGNYLLYRNHDSTYIKSYADRFTAKLLAISKINFFKINDRLNSSSIRFRPDRKLNLGIGIAYKWFALDLAFNFGIGEDSNFQNSNTLDFQGAIFSSKQLVFGTYQYYYGYQMTDIDGVPVDEQPQYDVRDDIRTASVILQYLFAFNYDKFSLKAPFIQNEVQLQNAGSFVMGARFQMINMDADSSAVPGLSQGYFEPETYLTSLTGSSLMVNFGYIYTFVFGKKFYATLGFIPGLGMSLGDYKTDLKQPFDVQINTGWSTINAVGYNSKKVFAGIQIVGDNYGFRLKRKLIFNQGHGKIKFHIGYRF